MEHKDRREMFSKFNSAKLGILISTDVSSRGLDFENVRWVVHYDINREVKEYVNRIGRTARLNKEGKSLCFLMENDALYVDQLKEVGLQMNPVKDTDILASFNQSFTHKKNSVMKPQIIIPQLTSLIKSTIGQNPSLITQAINAYRSSISAYAANSIRYKSIFNYKSLNFTDLAKGFCITKEWAQSEKRKRASAEGSGPLPKKHSKKAKEEHTPVFPLKKSDSKSQKMERAIRLMKKREATGTDF